jgi:hypothetical protein
MDSPIRKSAADIIGRSKTSVSVINAKFTSLRLPPAAIPQQSVGSLLAMAITAGKTHTADSIIAEAAQIRRQSKVTMAECSKQLETLKSGADHWFTVADYLKGDLHTLPNAVPEYLARSAMLVKSAAVSGSISAFIVLTLVDELKRNGTTALLYLAETDKKLTRIKSAGMVAAAVQADAFFSRIKSHKGFTKKDQARLQKYAPIVAHIAKERRLKHAAEHFQPHEFKRVYKNFETEVQL